MIRIEGDNLILNDAGFGLLCLVLAVLVGMLIWQVVGLIRDWRAWRKREKEGLSTSPPTSHLH
jgi:hypothetical protein